MSIPEESYKALFGYGHMRASYVDTTFPADGLLEIPHFVRREYLNILRNSLLGDQAIFSQHPNTHLQTQLSPISRQCLWELQSGIMIRLLENITDLINLLPDTHCECSGLNIINRPLTTINRNPLPVLLITIYLTTGSATLEKYPACDKNYINSTDIFYATYWQHPISHGGDSP